MKITLFALCMGLFITSCSKSDNFPDPIPPGGEGGTDPDEEAYRLKLKSDQYTVNIFDVMQFSLEKDPASLEEIFTLLDICSSYDSILFTVENIEGKYPLLRKTNTSVEITYNWGHTFFFPGTYKASLHSYRNNKIMSKDSIYITVSDSKDFLGFNWKDIVYNSDAHYVGYTDMLFKDQTFATYHSTYQDVPYIILDLTNHNREEEDIFAEKSKVRLTEYITSLYGLPTYDAGTGTSVSEVYEELFTYKEERGVPCIIWITPVNRMVLLEFGYDEFDYYEYHIHAEQNV